MSFHSLETNPQYINLQTEMVQMQRWVMESQQRLVILFEGRDTAGKGGAIMRFVRFINPRGYRIVALPKPTEVEKGQWYFQRYIKALPDPGEIVFFDRSWYNRAVVEPVMGFCSKEQYQLFMKQVVMVENMLIEDGTKIIKFWFSIDPEEQRRRLDERKTDPLKNWKLSTIDLQAQLKWDDYTYYKDEMFRITGKEYCPWVIIRGKDRDKARLEAMRYVLSKIDYPEKGFTGERITPDNEIVELRYF